MGVGPWTDGSQPAEPPEQPTRWKWGFGCLIGSVLVLTAVALVIRAGATAVRRSRRAELRQRL